METANKLEDALKHAYSIENMEGHGAAGREIDHIGTVEFNERLYLLYQDNNGNYWYRVKRRTRKGIVSEYEAIFGKKTIKK